jgi:hypothetical protein
MGAARAADENFPARTRTATASANPLVVTIPSKNDLDLDKLMLPLLMTALKKKCLSPHRPAASENQKGQGAAS